MTDEELIHRRLRMAKQALADAASMQQVGVSSRAIINRCYYAMFYSVLALANLRSYPTKKHQGAIAFFDREFVRTGIMPKELSAALHGAFDARLEADYAEVSEPSPSDALSTMKDAQIFVDTIATFVHKMLETM